MQGPLESRERIAEKTYEHDDVTEEIVGTEEKAKATKNIDENEIAKIEDIILIVDRYDILA